MFGTNTLHKAKVDGNVVFPLARPFLQRFHPMQEYIPYSTEIEHVKCIVGGQYL